MARDKLIDGFRAVAVVSVLFGHATNYRYADGSWMHYPQRLGGPLSELGVQLFFVISGFIITSLLVREEAKSERVSIGAFYTRRAFRILPPFAVLVTLVSADPISKLHAAAFTCNIAECQWGVAHSWSLAVEEQFYLAWPVLFVLLRRHRTQFLTLIIGVLVTAFLLLPPTFHSNALSFACIATGALVALQPRLMLKGRYWTWFPVAALLVLTPLMPFAKPMTALVPFLVAYILFGARDLPLIRRLLESRPFQWVGLASYSLYLWQQPFLGRNSDLPVWLLPLAVAVSVFLLERPFMKAGHVVSAWVKGREAKTA